jgi:enamine deaminase RidA (YjgF/YER057c/UK114 family)
VSAVGDATSTGSPSTGSISTGSISAVEQRLAELGLTVPDVAPPVAVYVPAVRDGDLVWTSGQLPMVGGSLAATGKVGDTEGCVSPEQAKDLARTCALNALAAVKSVVGDLDSVSRVVKVVGFVASDPGFTGQPGVVNGASELLGQAFGDAGVHARSAVGVAVLPLDAPVELEITVRVG